MCGSAAHYCGKAQPFQLIQSLYPVFNRSSPPPMAAGLSDPRENVKEGSPR